jgi:hypothetical protein
MNKEFQAHLRQMSAEVDTWPEWKRNLLGRTAAQGKSTGWRIIPGFGGRYRISDTGIVMSRIGRFGRKQGWTPMCNRLKKDGHLDVNLTDTAGRIARHLVHRLVLLTFRSGPSPGQVCRHLNGNPVDNRLENLVWGTISENVQDRLTHGYVYPRGCENPNYRHGRCSTPESYKAYRAEWMRKYRQRKAV